MHSPPPAERGGARLSAAIIVLTSGIAAAFLFGPLLQLKWLEGDLPFSPFRVEPTAAKPFVTRKVDAANGYKFTWVERKTERRAPALAMRITPLDVAGWWAPWKEKEVAEYGDGPQALVLYPMVPSADGFPPEESGRFCADASRPFRGCRMAHAYLQLYRDDGDWTHHDIVLGRRAPDSAESLPIKDRPIRVLREFWTQRDNAGRLAFRGWSCTPEQLAAETKALGPAHAADAPLQERMRCYEPRRFWERWLPARFGYGRQFFFVECLPNGSDCRGYFLFHRRLAELQFTWLPEADEEQEGMRVRLFLTGWQMLNRLHAAAADEAQAGEGELAEARIQAAACSALAQEAMRWEREAVRRDWPAASIACRRASAMALRVATASPKEAEPVLAQVADALFSVDGRSGEWERTMRARAAALESAGKGDSPEMLHLFATLYGGVMYSKEGKDFAQHGQAMQRGWPLARKYRVQAPQDRDRIHAALVNYYRQAGNAQAVIGVYEELLADLQQDHGAGSPRLMEPLRRLAAYEAEQNDFVAMKRVADRLRAVWLSRPEPLQGDLFEERHAEQDIGFALVVLYRNYAFKELRHAEVAPLAREITDRMERNLGAANAYFKAARFHQQEIATARAAPNGTPLGGGFLPKIW